MSEQPDGVGELDEVVASRPLLPEEAAAGSDDPELESQIILEDSEERTQHPEETKRDSPQTPDRSTTPD